MHIHGSIYNEHIPYIHLSNSNKKLHLHCGSTNCRLNNGAVYATCTEYRVQFNYAVCFVLVKEIAHCLHGIEHSMHSIQNALARIFHFHSFVRALHMFLVCSVQTSKKILENASPFKNPFFFSPESHRARPTMMMFSWRHIQTQSSNNIWWRLENIEWLLFLIFSRNQFHNISSSFLETVGFSNILEFGCVIAWNENENKKEIA